MKNFYRLVLLIILVLSVNTFAVNNRTVSAQSLSTMLLLMDTQTGANVGEVAVSVENNVFTAAFLPSSSAGCLQSTYLYIGTTAPGAPFTYPNQHTSLACAATDTFVVSGSWTGQVYVAAYADFSHEEVVEDDLSVLTGTSSSLDVTMGTGSSYLQVDVLSSASALLLDQFPAWCIDPHHIITPDQGIVYPANVYYSYSPLPDGLVGGSMDGFTENIDLVNYVLNHTADYIAQGAKTIDIQTIIWGLVDPGYAKTIADTEGTLVWTLYQDALTNGEDYTPSCGELVGVILEPTDANDSQHLLVAVPVPCSTVTVVTHAATSLTTVYLAPLPTNTPISTPTPEPTPTLTTVFGCQKHNPERLDCSSLEVTAYCSANLAVFNITNTGEPGNGDMRAPTQWRLWDVATNTLINSGTVLLTGGQTMTLTFEWGQEIRLEADQQIGHPGNSHPQASLMCGVPVTSPEQPGGSNGSGNSGNGNGNGNNDKPSKDRGKP